MRASLAVVLGLFVAVALAGCWTETPECPVSYYAPNLERMVGEVFIGYASIQQDGGPQPAHPYSGSGGERRLEVTSDSTVSLVYERDGKLVVETYVVTGTVVRSESW